MFSHRRRVSFSDRLYDSSAPSVGSTYNAPSSRRSTVGYAPTQVMGGYGSNTRPFVHFAQSSLQHDPVGSYAAPTAVLAYPTPGATSYPLPPTTLSSSTASSGALVPYDASSQSLPGRHSLTRRVSDVGRPEMHVWHSRLYPGQTELVTFIPLPDLHLPLPPPPNMLQKPLRRPRNSSHISRRSTASSDGRPRAGWFNKRGDELLDKYGRIAPVHPSHAYPRELRDYPVAGWMNEDGLVVDSSLRVVHGSTRASNSWS